MKCEHSWFDYLCSSFSYCASNCFDISVRIIELQFRYHSIAFLSMALAPMKTLANRFVLDVFVIIERAINGIVHEQHDTTLSNVVCWWQFLSIRMKSIFLAFISLAGHYFQAHSSASIPQDAWQRCIVCRPFLTRDASSICLVWLLFRFYCCAPLSDSSRIILWNIFVDDVLKTSCLGNVWSYLQAWYSFVSRLAFFNSCDLGPDSFWASLWHAWGAKRRQVAGLWSSKLVTLVQCKICWVFVLSQTHDASFFF